MSLRSSRTRVPIPDVGCLLSPSKRRILLHRRRNVASQRRPPIRRTRTCRCSPPPCAGSTCPPRRHAVAASRPLLRPRHLRHAIAEPLHLALDDLLLSLQRALFALDTLMPDLALQRLHATLAIFELRQRIRQALHCRGEFLAAAAAGALWRLLLGDARVGDAGHEGRVLHETLVALGRGEVVGDGGGIGAESLERREGMHGASEALLAKGARRGLLESWWEGSL